MQSNYVQLFLELLLLSLVAPSGDLHAGVAWCAVVCAGPASSLYSVQSSPCLACWRRWYKVRPARLVGGENGRKFAMRAQNTPNWAFLGEQGEFCTAHAVRRGVPGEFCTGSGAVRLVLGEFCTGSGAVRLVLGEFYTGSGAV